MAKKKTAMVKPKPTGPEPEQTSFKGSDITLEFLLGKLNNNRPYTILSHEGKSWRLHFYGDPAPCTVKWEGGKVKIVK